MTKMDLEKFKGLYEKHGHLSDLKMSRITGLSRTSFATYRKKVGMKKLPDVWKETSAAMAPVDLGVQYDDVIAARTGLSVWQVRRLRMARGIAPKPRLPFQDAIRAELATQLIEVVKKWGGIEDTPTSGG